VVQTVGRADAKALKSATRRMMNCMVGDLNDVDVEKVREAAR